MTEDENMLEPRFHSFGVPFVSNYFVVYIFITLCKVYRTELNLYTNLHFFFLLSSCFVTTTNNNI
jgi:Ca2+-binding EF-hand superfamily protein